VAISAHGQRGVIAESVPNRTLGIVPRPVCPSSRGDIRDRTFENQRYRASGLNLAIATIILWNTIYLDHAVAELRAQAETPPDKLLVHIAPLGWEHIIFNGDYVWPSEPLKEGFRPLRNPRSAFLDAA
jgi:hypothetical protein